MKISKFKVIKTLLVLFIIILSGELFSQPLAEGKGKFLGSISKYSVESTFLDYWNQVTPENAGKWGSVQNSSTNTFNWTSLDNAYDYAIENDIPFKMHTLIWGNQQPSWIEDLDSDSQRDAIENWMMEFGDRYPDAEFIEVVNEPINDPPNQAGSGGGNYIDALGGSGATGWDWVITSFELARQYCPNAKLMINEFGIINSTSNINKYLEIINLLKERNLIDAIGIQSHYFSLANISSSTIRNNLDKLAETELPIYITELDIDGESDDGLTQLDRYRKLFPPFWQHEAVKGITLWGWVQNKMWREDAYLVRSDGTERPALKWLKNFVKYDYDWKNISRRNVILNPDFDNGLDDWTGWIDEENTDVTVSIDSSWRLSTKNSMKLEIIEASDDGYRIQRNTLLPLEYGYKYEIYFSGVADKDSVLMQVILEENQEPYAKRLDTLIYLTTTPTQYELLLDANIVVDSTNQLKFMFGGANNDNATVWLDGVSVIPKVVQIVSVDETDNGVIPGDFKLEQNYPNPFNPSTTINYSIPNSSEVQLKVFDALGKEIAMLVNQFQNAGSYNINFDASKLTSGIYFYQLKSDQFFNTRKMILIK